jgi:hypothetical protein
VSIKSGDKAETPDVEIDLVLRQNKKSRLRQCPTFAINMYVGAVATVVVAAFDKVVAAALVVSAKVVEVVVAAVELDAIEVLALVEKPTVEVTALDFVNVIGVKEAVNR